MSEPDTIWAWLLDKNNREAITWLIATAGSVIGALLSLRAVFKSRSKPKPDGKPASKQDNRAYTGFGDHTNITNSGLMTVVVGRGVPLVVFLIFAGFAALAIQALSSALGTGGGVNVARACASDLPLSTSHIEAAKALNARGNAYRQDGNYSRAAACYEAAHQRSPASWPPLENLITIYGNIDAADNLDKAMRYADRLIGLQSEQMRAFRLDLSGVGHLSCADRLRFTKEGFSTKPWEYRIALLVVEERWADAIATAQEASDTYPSVSCDRAGKQGRMRMIQGDLLCLSGAEADAIATYESLKPWFDRERDTARQYQRFLKDAGHYRGLIDGDFGPGTQAALPGWVAARCPGVELYYR